MKDPKAELVRIFKEMVQVLVQSRLVGKYLSCDVQGRYLQYSVTNTGFEIFYLLKILIHVYIPPVLERERPSRGPRDPSQYVLPRKTKSQNF